MCKKEYINLQTKEMLDLEKVTTLPDNAMLKVKPELWCEWDFKKNSELGFDAWKIAKASNKKVWWKCEKGHEWDSALNNRIKGYGCPYCAGNKAWRGETDMWTTNPKMASWLLNPEVGYNYMQCSGKHVDWKCPDCGEVIKNKAISKINERGLSCPKCSDGITYPEKFMYILLKELDVEFVKELTSKNFKWIGNKRYDFYIPSLNMIIETHGEQHSRDSGFERIGGRTVEEEQENDKYKRDLALNNGIAHYIELDCSESKMKHMRNSIVNSRLVEFFDLNDIDWEHLALQSEKSLVYDVCDLWNKGLSTSDIINKTMLCRCTVINYLNRGNKIDVCNYDKHESLKRGMKNFTKPNIIKVVQLTLDNDYIKTWNSIADAHFELINKRTGGISYACNSKTKTAYGYKWMYLDDYNYHIENNIPIITYKNSQSKYVVQLSKEGKYIKTFSSILEASKEADVWKTAITACCKGRLKSTGGYKWMYKEDYEKLNNKTS